ncbi:MAG: exosortase/archaeosortase family protein [Limisphaerales bacterium]
MNVQKKPFADAIGDNEVNSAVPVSPSLLNWIIVLLPLAYLWFRLIDNLRFEWMTDPQYGYGLLVPLLCLGLMMRRWPFLPKEPTIQHSTSTFILLFAFFAFLYLPTRLIEAAVPEWRPIQWSLGVEAIGLTLCVVYLAKGRGWLRQLAFPICFFFVAIPWPSLFETPIIQTLTRVSAAIVVDVLGCVGIPALVHGNILEVSTGMVGIDEACSGIRSFQSSLMISLFLGEFYRLSRGYRLLLIPLGFLFSMAFNICRMSLLTMIAAKKGVGAIAKYHDPAGITIAILCTLTLWALAAWVKNRSLKNQIPKPSSPSEVPSSESPACPFAHFPILNRLGFALIVWLVVVEAGVQIWYRSRELHIKPGPAWTLNFPKNNPTLKDLPIDSATRNLLRFDEGKQAAWTEADGTQWEGFYFSWLPGRVAGYLAKRHTPEICLEATGLQLVSGPKLTVMNVHGLELPIRCYTFESGGQLLQVFHCLWDAGATSDSYVTHVSSRFNLIRAVWEGRGDKGQKVLEFVISGMDDPVQAKSALALELNKLIKVEN